MMPDKNTLPEGTVGIYALLDWQSKPLYIGHSRDIRNRVYHHYSKPWWHEVITLEWKPCKTIEEARDLERHDIVTRHPRYNIMWNGS